MTGNPSIHPSAVVEEGAEIGAGALIGPFCHIGPDAVIGERVTMIGHVTVLGATTIGARCTISPNAVLGGLPQSLRHKGGRTTLRIGEDCVIREGVTMSVGTDTAHGETVVGARGFFMAGAHVAHDCIIGDNVTMANSVALGGHVEVGDFVTLGGGAAVHQFVRIGHHAFVGGFGGVIGDVIPYGMAMGDRAKLRGLNVVGIKRSGLPRAELMTMRAAYRLLFSPDRPMADNIPLVEAQYGSSRGVADILAFIKARGKRFFTVPALGRSDADDDGDDPV